VQVVLISMLLRCFPCG